MVIKICGITRLEDAMLAVDLGARALGFVLWPGSPRHIDPPHARAIVRELPPFVTAVGVFVNEPPEVINTLADAIRLGVVQLHGDEPVSHAEQIERPVLKSVTVQDAEKAAAEWPGQVTLLIDAHDPQRRGGTGQTTDWTVAAALAARRRILLAGGLRPENVGEAISRVRPYGIDVSSGVEASPGIKDPDRLRALFRAVTFVQAGS
jgi:phosphoribosylanthranilate isomerase